MADITLSPLPYNGGTYQTTSNTFNYCQLSSTKFLHVAAQTTPGYIYAFVVTMNNLKTGTFSSSAGPMRAILSGSSVPTTISSIRLVRLSATRAILAVTGTGATNPTKLYVLEVVTGDDIVVKNASLTTGVLTALSSCPTIANGYYAVSSSGTAVGSNWQLFNPRDGVVYVADRDTSNSSGVQYRLRKIAYDSSADSLSNGILVNNSFGSLANSGANSFTRFYLQDIPGSTTKLFSVRVHLNGTSNNAYMQNSYIVYAALISDTDVVTPLNGTLPTNIQTLVPLSTTTILGLTSTKAYLTYNGTAWNSTPAVFTPAGGTNTIIDAIALDANYFMMITIALSNNDMAAFNLSLNTRVVRYVDASFGQTSTATASGEGVSIGSLPFVFPDQCFTGRDGTDAIYVYGRTNGNFASSIKVLYQAGA